LECGKLSVTEGAVILLEDDLYTDPSYYEYALAAVNWYYVSDRVAGIALYGPEYNGYAGLPFQPLRNGYSTYPMQVPCSWGQCWSKKNWLEFMEWFSRSDHESVLKTPGLPPPVKKWPESSWKKYFSAYLVQTNKYFIYPYESFTTNCSDRPGTHIRDQTSKYQVSLSAARRESPVFRFCDLQNPEVLYDAYMEQNGRFINSVAGLDRENVCVNLYGVKPHSETLEKKLVLSRIRSSSVVKRYPLSFRPIEYNLLFDGSASELNKGIYLCRTESVNHAASAKFQTTDLEYFARMPILARFATLDIGKILFRRIMKSLRNRWVKKMSRSVPQNNT
jgi:hypothetical protein